MPLLITEEDAKYKWCPFARTIREVEVEDVQKDIIKTKVLVANREYMSDEKDPSCTVEAPQFNCMGSACMAWRESDGTSIQEKLLFEGIQSALQMGALKQEDIKRTKLGYCGLAGK